MSTVARRQVSLHQFIAELEDRHLYFRLDRIRQGSVMVVVAVPGQRWEVEFFEDGTIEVERFISDGVISDESAFGELWPLAK
jgi:hypothetical protein